MEKDRTIRSENVAENDNAELYIENEADSPYLKRVKKIAKSAHAIVERDEGKEGLLAKNFRFKSKTLDHVVKNLKRNNAVADSEDAFIVIEDLVGQMDIYDGLNSEYIAADRFNDREKMEEINKRIEDNKRRLGVVCDVSINELGIDYEKLCSIFAQDDNSTIAAVWDEQLGKYDN